MNRQILTPTELRTYKSCRMKHHLRYDEGLVPKQEPDYFSLGRAGHKMLEHYYRDGVTGIEVDDSHNLDDKDRMTLLAWARSYYDNDPVKEFNHEVKEIEWELPELRIRNPETGYPSHKYVMSGRIDLITEDENGNLWLWDHKTSSSGLDQSVGHLVFDFQMSSYLWAVREAGMEVEGLIYNLLRKPSIRPRKEETEDEYFGRLLDDMIEKRPEFYFQTERIIKDDHDLDLVQSELWNITQDMNNNNNIYRNESACRIFSCPYSELCYRDNQATRKLAFEQQERHPELDDDIEEIGF